MPRSAVPCESSPGGFTKVMMSGKGTGLSTVMVFAESNALDTPPSSCSSSPASAPPSTGSVHVIPEPVHREHGRLPSHFFLVFLHALQRCPRATCFRVVFSLRNSWCTPPGAKMSN
eukprot:701566-Rhodomonas_salina.2